MSPIVIILLITLTRPEVEARPHFERVDFGQTRGRVWHRAMPLNVPREVNRSLVFMHIPKTAGNSITEAFRFLNISQGRRRTRFGTGLQYATVPIKCHYAFHTPPRLFVADSLVVVRDPYERLVSEICFLKTYQLAREYATGNASSTCAVFRSRARDFLEAAVRFTGQLEDFDATGKVNNDLMEGHRTRGCMAVPQWPFVQHAEWVIELTALDEALPALMRRYGLSPVGELRHKNARNTCPTIIRNGSCLDDELRSAIDRWERGVWPLLLGRTENDNAQKY